MNSEEPKEQDIKKEIVAALRKRAAIARRNANIALLSIFLIIFCGISLFYFAGDIVIEQTRPIAIELQKKPISNE